MQHKDRSRLWFSEHSSLKIFSHKLHKLAQIQKE